MTHLLRIFSFAVLGIAFFVAGCEGPAGDVGPPGDDGQDGEQGPEGPPGPGAMAMMVTLDADSLEMTSDGTWSYTFNVPAIDEDIVNGGAVHGYLGLMGESTYMAQMDTLNQEAIEMAGGTLDAEFDGWARFTVSDATLGGQFMAETEGMGKAPNNVTPQHIHAADTCPTMDADENGDGFIDVIEGAPSYGLIFAGLNSDLSSSLQGENMISDSDGNFSYSQTTNLRTFMSDVRADRGFPFTDTEDDEALNLEGRTVVFHGVEPDTDLPETVATLETEEGEIAPNWATLPIACGEIMQESAEDSTYAALPMTRFADASADGMVDGEVTINHYHSEGQLTVEVTTRDGIDTFNEVQGDHHLKVVIIPPGDNDGAGAEMDLDFATYEEAARLLDLPQTPERLY